MSTIAYGLGALALIGCALIGILFWRVRRPVDPRDTVSDEWRDEQLRGRRE
jgi:hypothetical protein